MGTKYGAMNDDDRVVGINTTELETLLQLAKAFDSDELSVGDGPSEIVDQNGDTLGMFDQYGTLLIGKLPKEYLAGGDDGAENDDTEAPV